MVMAMRWLLVLELLANARAKGGKTVRELLDALAAEGIRVSPRTLERDLNTLSAHFPLACEEEGRTYRWSWIGARGLSISAAQG